MFKVRHPTPAALTSHTKKTVAQTNIAAVFFRKEKRAERAATLFEDVDE
jgi:hypothetical protein